MVLLLPSAAPTAPAARLHSLRSAPPTAKVLHLVRHAEGTHNVTPDHKTPANLDAPLTSEGLEQCCRLSRITADLDLDAIVVSPTTRCLQTAIHSFDAAWNGEVPMIAYEEWRETVNFLCDARRPTSALRASFPAVDFARLRDHESDPLWDRYEALFGCWKTHSGMRESGDGPALERRAREAWAALAERPERALAVVSHSAFFMHMFTPLFGELEGLVQYEDEGVRDLMTGPKFENCELRSVAFEAP